MQNVWFCPVIEFARSHEDSRIIHSQTNELHLKNRYRTHRFVNKKMYKPTSPKTNQETLPTKSQSPPRLYQERRKNKLQLHAEHGQYHQQPEQENPY